MPDTVIPYLNVRDGWEALEFYRAAFGAEAQTTIEREGGRLAHADVSISGARFMLRHRYPEYGFRSPDEIGGTPVNLFVYVEDVAAFFERATAAGAKVIRPVEPQFHGDLMTELEDPFGHSWFFVQHVADMTPDELKRKAQEVGL